MAARAALAPYMAIIKEFEGIHFAAEFLSPMSLIVAEVELIMLKLTSWERTQGMSPP